MAKNKPQRNNDLKPGKSQMFHKSNKISGGPKTKFDSDNISSNHSFFIKSSSKQRIDRKNQMKSRFNNSQGQLRNSEKFKSEISATNKTDNTSEKKKFDKKLWRTKKYSNKYKVQQWEERRKKFAQRDYEKSLKKDNSKFDVQKIYKEFDKEINEINYEDTGASLAELGAKRKSNKGFKKAYDRFEKVKSEKQLQKEERLRRKAEREKAIKAYKNKKLETFKKLSKKTKKGQPVMKDRMELLLEKIKQNIN